MNKYECAVIYNPGSSAEVLASSAKKYSNIITSGGGELTHSDDWGKRTLAYEIDHHREGVYHFYRFNGGGEIVHELNRQLRIDENVLRHMVVRDEAPEAPAGVAAEDRSRDERPKGGES